MINRKDRTFDDALALYEIILKYTRMSNLLVFSNKLLGPVIRVLQYRITEERKERLMKIVGLFFDKKMPVVRFED